MSQSCCRGITQSACPKPEPRRPSYAYDLLANMILCLNASNEVANGSAGHLIPKTSITNLTPWIDEIGNASSKLAEAFETQLGVGQILRFDYSTFTGTLDNGNQFDASSFFTTLEAALQIVLERLLPLQVFRQTKGTRIGSARPTRDLLRSLVKSLTTNSNKLARNSTSPIASLKGSEAWLKTHPKLSQNWKETRTKQSQTASH